MSFTDEDLRKLKEYINNDNFAYADGCPDFLRAHGIVARLEAAERVARWFNHIKTEDPNCEPFKDFEKWKKAAGKE